MIVRDKILYYFIFGSVSGVLFASMFSGPGAGIVGAGVGLAGGLVFRYYFNR